MAKPEGSESLVEIARHYAREIMGEIISDRTKATLGVKKRRGERVGQVPFGYDVAEDGVMLVPNAAEQEVIALVRRLRAGGLSFAKIAVELNRRGVATKERGGRWHETSIIRLLKAGSE